MLAIMLLAIILLLSIFIPINLMTLSNQTFVVQVLIIMALEGGLLWLTRRGNVNLAGWLFTLLTVLSVISTVALAPSPCPLVVGSSHSSGDAATLLRSVPHYREALRSVPHDALASTIQAVGRRRLTALRLQATLPLTQCAPWAYVEQQ
jgi:hypothetical protein